MDPRDLLLRLVAAIPLRLASGLAWLVAWTWWWILPFRRAEAVRNLARVLPGRPPRPLLVRRMHDVVLGYMELARYHLDRRAGRESSLRFNLDLRGATPGSIIVAAHSGAFDLVVLHFAEVHPCTVFVRTPANPWVRARMAEIRRVHGMDAQETGARHDAAYAALAAGRSVIYMQDQAYRKGLETTFFGAPALTSAGAAAASLRTNAPTWGAWVRRLGLGEHEVVFEPLELPPPTGNDTADVLARTEVMNRWYERHILAEPEQWWWWHRRWKRAKD